ncbi:helix-turn-helix domain-containing protein [Serratia marcescens]|uniref:helix-turn-helix domain-containing protein n=1 Tax=Serratia marcescens TaxID=615 RepID=UPI0021B61E93|nr:helix-turn-helix domain-containing protein [Serratia marcescens]
MAENSKKIYKVVVRDVIEWINENLEEQLHIERISAKSGYSKWHFQRIFKEETGISLGKYIRERKLSHAYQLLVNTDMSVIDISTSLGFTSQQVFSRTVKKELRRSPRDIRKNGAIQPS